MVGEHRTQNYREIRSTDFGKGNNGRELGGGSLVVDLDHQRVVVDCSFGSVAGMIEGSKREVRRLFEDQ
jgi:hypothetical protein